MLNKLTNPLSLFTRFGVELEYMIVDADTLDVRPIADRLLAQASGVLETEDFDDGPICWSNELVNHVIELKVNGPVLSLEGLDATFAASVTRINELLRQEGARLMPTAMHPWMRPDRETQLWPHGSSAIYQALDRVFNCQGHGWSNLQSAHINLPFANDEEFGRLHAAIRLLLPILPALAASSPLMEGRPTGLLDNRMNVYRTNCARIPSVTGAVIPEPVYREADYQEIILARMYSDIAPHDPEKLLQEEFLNARGAIARFYRNTIEIRVLDVQECPAADLAIVRLTVAVLRALVAERWSDLPVQQAWPVEPLQDILLATTRDADQAIIANADYLRTFGLSDKSSCRASELWQHLAAVTGLEADPWLRLYLRDGALARRLLPAVGATPDRQRLTEVSRQLCECLAANRFFSLVPAPAAREPFPPSGAGEAS
jgi:gamma-glutamyl:cysteine ligase YbdK (ATP-grasp superfamily)